MDRVFDFLGCLAVACVVTGAGYWAWRTVPELLALTVAGVVAVAVAAIQAVR